MTEEERQKMTDEAMSQINFGVTTHNMATLAGSIATSLLRIANAQELLYELSQVDLQETVEAEIKGRAETLANEMQEEKSKRSFIGKRT